MNQGTHLEAAAISLLSCLYCDIETFEMGQGSQEHAILSSLGGRKSSRNVCCTSCNNRLGDEVDAPMAKNFAFISANVGIVTGRNQPAATLQRFIEVEGQSIDLIAGGEFKLSKGTVRIDHLPDGNYGIAVNANTVEEGEYLRTQVMRKFPKELYRVESTEVVRISTPVPMLRDRIAHGTPELRRAAAKIALTYLATMVDPRRLRAEIFQPVVRFIRGDGDEPPGISGIEQVELGTPLLPSPFTHSLLTVADADSGYVLALLRICDTFGYTIRLATGWDGPSTGRLYGIDPVTGRSEEKDLDVAAIMRTYRPDAEPDLEAFNSGVSRLLHAIAARQRSTLISQTIEDVIGVDRSPDEVMTEEDARKAISQILERLIPSLLRVPHQQRLHASHMLEPALTRGTGGGEASDRDLGT